MKLKIWTLIALAGLVGGCTATITPRGDIYTEALLPAVVVESPRPVFVSRHHRPARPMGPVVSGRTFHRPSPRGHISHYPSIPGHRH